MCHLLRQAPLKVYVIVDDGEALLLQAYDAVRTLVDNSHRIGLVADRIAQPHNTHVAEGDAPRNTPQRKHTVSQTAVGIFVRTVRFVGLRVAHHLRARDRDRDVASAHRHLEVEPLAVLGKRTVEVAHRRQRPALARAVDGAVAEQNLISALRAVGMERQSRLGPGRGEGLTLEHEAAVLALGKPCLPCRDRNLTAAHRTARNIAEAVQRYGHIVSHTSGNRRRHGRRNKKAPHAPKTQIEHFHIDRTFFN